MKLFQSLIAPCALFMKISNVKSFLFFIGCVLPNFLGATWNLPPLTIPNPSNNVITPSVGIDDAGNAVAVFSAFDGANFVIQAATLPYGGAWSAPVTLSTTGQDSEKPRVTVRNNGDAVAVWSRSDGSNKIVQAAQLPFGGSWSAVVDISDPGVDGQLPRIVINGLGQATAVWQNFNGVNFSIKAASLPFGGVWTFPIDGSVPGLGEDHTNPKVAIDQNGNAVAVWERNTGFTFTIQATTIPFGGSPSVPATISGAGDSFSPQVDVDDGGNAIAVWEEFNGADGIIRSAQLPFGGGWTSPVDVSLAGQSGTLPQVKFDIASNVVAVWSRYDGANAVILGSTMLFGGGWSAPVNISDSSESASNPVLGIDIGGNATTVWDTASKKIQTSTYDFDSASWDAPLDLSNADGTLSSLPDMAENICGDVAVVWQNDDAGVNSIQSATNTCDLPTITSLSPNNGSLAGTTSVVITGTHFTGVTTVQFGTVNATFVVDSSTKITATAPVPTSNSACTVNVIVTTCCGTSNAASFTYNTPAPTVTNLSPNMGPLAGGTVVTITGTGFIGVTGPGGVKFGTVNATSYTVNSPTQITATSPAGTTCVVNVRVTGCGGTSAISAANQFTYVYGSPTVTGILPSNTGVAGNTRTITGTNFIGVTSVTFGATPAAFSNVTPTSLDVVVPVTNDCTLDVRVTTCKGTSPITAADKFTYIRPAPTVTSVAPNAGAIGTSVTITGTNFYSVTAVEFGTANATSFIVNSLTQITAVVPAPASGSPCTVDITVTACGGISAITPADQFTYTGPPTVTGLSPNNGPSNILISVTGTNFVGVTAVKFGTLNAAAFTVISSTQIIATSPTLPANAPCVVDVTVTACGGTSASSPADLYTYTGTPTVTGLSTHLGSGGTLVSIAGTNFDEGVTDVKFGTISATFTIISATQIDATAPTLPANSSCTVNVRVITCGGTSPLNPPNDEFTYNGTVTVTGLSPSNGPSGTSVTITGTGFDGVSDVKFGTVSAPFTVNSSTQIIASVPAAITNSPCTVNVTVTACGGISATNPANEFNFDFPAPTLTLLNPDHGSSAGGTPVTITGTNFHTPSTVEFGTQAGTGVTVTDSTTMQVVSPAAVPNSNCTVDVAVASCNQTSANTLPFDYDFPAPTIISLSPTSGPVGQSVTITGTNFHAPSTVDFGGVPGINPVVVNSTTITVTAPQPLDCIVNVTVTTCGNQTSNAAVFTYTGLQAPTVTVVNPNFGPAFGGNSVEITGTNFIGVTNVAFGANNSLSFTVNSPTSITAEAPGGDQCDVNVVVTTCVGSSPITPSSIYMYVFDTPNPRSVLLDPVTITNLSPNSGSPAGGTSVSITGTGFNDVVAVQFGGISASFVRHSSTSITAISPPAGDDCVVDVVVITCEAGTSPITPADKFTYLFPAPTVTNVSPNSGSPSGGNSVDITGTNFLDIVSVKFGDVEASFVQNSSTSITAIAPAGIECQVDVRVTGCGSTSAITDADHYNYLFGAPEITGVNPNEGPASGGNTVEISGNNFIEVTSVKFGDEEAQFLANATSPITATVPQGSNCDTVDVIVTACGGTSSITNLDQYTYKTAPSITSIEPDSGSTSGGGSVIIHGNNLDGVTIVRFGNNNANFIINSPTQITATVPAGSVGTVEITVTNCAGTASGQYTYENVFPPSKFIGCIKKDEFLNKSECTLETSWKPSFSPNIVAYKIYKNHKLIATIPAKSRLCYDRKLSSCSAKGYSITAVDQSGQESTPVKLKIESH